MAGHTVPSLLPIIPGIYAATLCAAAFDVQLRGAMPRESTDERLWQMANISSALSRLLF